MELGYRGKWRRKGESSWLDMNMAEGEREKEREAGRESIVTASQGTEGIMTSTKRRGRRSSLERYIGKNYIYGAFNKET